MRRIVSGELHSLQRRRVAPISDLPREGGSGCSQRTSRIEPKTSCFSAKAKPLAIDAVQQRGVRRAVSNRWSAAFMVTERGAAWTTEQATRRQQHRDPEHLRD